MLSSCRLTWPAFSSRWTASSKEKSPPVAREGSTSLSLSVSSCVMCCARCVPGMTFMAPLAASLSSKATHTVTELCGASGQKKASWCQGVVFASPGSLLKNCEPQM